MTIRLILLKTLRDLWRSRAQSLALILIIALGIACFTALVGAYRDLGTSYNHTYNQLHFADVTFAVESAPQGVVNDIAAINGVGAASGRLIIDSGFVRSTDASRNAGPPIRARLIGIPSDHHPAVDDVLVTQGRYLAPEDDLVALVESHFAGVYHLGPGDTVSPIINGQPLSVPVVGIAASPEYLLVSPSKQEIMPSPSTFAVLFVPLAALQKQVGAVDSINNIAVQIAPQADTSAVIKTIQDTLQPYTLESTTLRADQPSNAALQLDLGGYKTISTMMPALFLLVAAVSVYAMLERQVRAQHQQIGLMKALGYSSETVMGHYLAFALVIALVGSVLGILAGIPLEHSITQSYATELGIPLVKTRFYFDLAGAGVLLSFGVAVLAGIIPSRQSARIEPAQAMRFNPSSALVSGRRSIIERLITLPVTVRLSLRNVFRVRNRSVTTALGVIFTYALVLMAWGMINSMQYMLNHHFQEVERWDMMMVFDTEQTPATLDQITSLKGIQRAEPVIQIPAKLKTGSHDTDILLTALPVDQTMHHFDFRSGTTSAVALAADHIVLTAALADAYHVKPGDTVTVVTSLGSRDLMVGGISSELVGSVSYVSLDTLQTEAGTSALGFNSVYLTVNTSQIRTLQSTLYQLPNVASVEVKQDVRRDWTSLMDLFYVFTGVALLFAVAMGFALLFNAMTINVLERQREFATMRAFGTGSQRISGMMMMENVVIWLLTLVPGLLLGYWLTIQMGTSFQSELFSFQVVIFPTSYVITALGILVTMIVATWPPIRHINHLNLAEATKTLT
jgi:putative ABC transport system permease protein